MNPQDQEPQALPELTSKEVHDIYLSWLMAPGTNEHDLILIGLAFEAGARAALATPQDVSPPPEPALGDWRIDHSTGRPILMHKDCSVIEAEQAYTVLGLLRAAHTAPPSAPASEPAEPPVVHQPHIGADEEGSATLEWRSGPRKLTLYTVSPPEHALLQSWGVNMEAEMVFVPVTDVAAVRAAFAWLFPLPATSAPAEPATCKGDPGECAHNGACMYACGSAPAEPLSDGRLWSFVRSVMSQGACIYQDYASGHYKTYEAYSAHLDAAASNRAAEFQAAVHAKQGGAS